MPKKRTHEEFVQLLKETTEGTFEALETYINNKTPILVKHKPCGSEFPARPQEFFQDGVRCDTCFVLKKERDFQEHMKNYRDGTYLVKGKYIDWHTPIEVIHKTCGTPLNNPPKYYYSGIEAYCTTCSQKEILDQKHKEFVKYVEDTCKGEYVVLGNFINTSTNIPMKHSVCGHEWEPRPGDFIYSDSRCPKCSGHMKKTLEIFKKEVKNEVGDEYTVLGKVYIKNNIPIRMQHNICKHKYYVRPDRWTYGDRCPNCSPNKKLTHEEFVQRVYEQVDDEYTVMSEYITTMDDIMMRHNLCGCEYPVKPYAFTGVMQRRCPKCSSSKGEKRIAKYLDENRISYKPEYTFPDCKYKRPIPFDFAVFDNENELAFIIEYDGIHHFEPIKQFGGEENFKLVQKKDQIKNKYCEKNDIPLIRIPYWDFNNIEAILAPKIKFLQTSA